MAKIKTDETYQVILIYENKITNNFLYSILPNKSYSDYLSLRSSSSLRRRREDYHRDINELSDEMEKDIKYCIDTIKEILNYEQ